MSTPLELLKEWKNEFCEWEEWDFYERHTLWLLQALHDELEGKKMVVEMALGNPKAMAALRGYNDSIQDQQDNLHALKDKIQV